MRLFYHTEPHKIQGILSDVVGYKLEYVVPESISSAISTRLVEDNTNNGVFNDLPIDLRTIFTQLRETGTPSSAEGLATIKTLVDSCKVEVEALKSGLSTLTPTSNEFIESSARLLQRANQVRLGEYILSPQTLLPFDVLEQIFVWYLGLFDPQDILYDAKQLCLATVCYRWRSVVLSVPGLWNLIYLCINSSHYAERFKRFSTRTTFPSVMLGALSSGDHSVMEDSFKFISDNSIQFRKLSFYLERKDDVSTEDIFTRIAHNHCQQLEELVFLDRYEASLSKSMSELMPLLKKLYLHNLPEEWNPATTNPPAFPTFLHLSRLHFTEAIPYQTIDIILSQCPQLQQLSVTLSSTLEDPATPAHIASSGPPIPHPNLVYLALSNDHGMTVIPTNFLHNWSFPNLRMMDYQLDDSDMPWILSHPLLSTVSRLVIVRHDACGGYENEETLPAILSHAHSVEEFGMACLDVGGDARVLKDTAGVLTSIVTSPLHAKFVESVKRINLMGLDDCSVVWGSCAQELQVLCEAWSSHLDHLVLRCQDQSGVGIGSPEILAALKAGANAGVKGNEGNAMDVELWCYLDYVGLPFSPVGFQMWPFAFDKSVPMFEVLKDDGTWEVRRCSAYHIV